LKKNKQPAVWYEKTTRRRGRGRRAADSLMKDKTTIAAIAKTLNSDQVPGFLAEILDIVNHILWNKPFCILK
jgi:hypothetical protein